MADRCPDPKFRVGNPRRDCRYPPVRARYAIGGTSGRRPARASRERRGRPGRPGRRAWPRQQCAQERADEWAGGRSASSYGQKHTMRACARRHRARVCRCGGDPPARTARAELADFGETDFVDRVRRPEPTDSVDYRDGGVRRRGRRRAPQLRRRRRRRRHATRSSRSQLQAVCRAYPFRGARIAQLVEHRSCNAGGCGFESHSGLLPLSDLKPPAPGEWVEYSDDLRTAAPLRRADHRAGRGPGAAGVGGLRAALHRARTRRRRRPARRRRRVHLVPDLPVDEASAADARRGRLRPAGRPRRGPGDRLGEGGRLGHRRRGGGDPDDALRRADHGLPPAAGRPRVGGVRASSGRPW